MAVLSAEDVDPVVAIVASWPDNALVTDLPIAEHWHDAGRLQRRSRSKTSRHEPVRRAVTGIRGPCRRP